MRLLLTAIPVLAWLALGPDLHAQLVAPGSTWTYLDDGSDQGSAWTAPAFDDSTWATGMAEFGYGDDDEATVVDFGTNASDKHITTYFRHEFQVVNPGGITTLHLHLLDDDGTVVYLNGVELVRSNMPAGPIDHLTQAVFEVGFQENNWDTFVLNPASLLSGTNVLAVEVHQANPDSEDLGFDLELTEQPNPAVVRGPYLQRIGPDRVVLRWRTDLEQDSRVSYGAAPGSLIHQVDDSTLTRDHTVELTGLSADTTYFYSIGSTTAVFAGDDLDHWFRTAPPVGDPRPNRFWILGDCGSGTPDQVAVRDAYRTYTGATATDLILFLGDNAYVDGTDAEYQLALFDMYAQDLRTAPWFSTRGNHEKYLFGYHSLVDHPMAGELGGLPSGSEAYYSFDYGNVHFVCLDSQGTDRSPGGAMATWLEADLASTMQPWVIAYWHHPPYTKGTHDSDDPLDSGGRMQEMREVFGPILEAGGVDLVLSGHSHTYERSFLIDGHYGDTTTWDPQYLVDGGDGMEAGTGAYAKDTAGRRGAIYTVAGTASRTGTGTLDHPAMYLSLATLGSVVLDVSDQRLDLRFLDSTGAVLDHCTLLTDVAQPTLTISNLMAGAVADVQLSDCAADALVFVGYSLTGPGPTTTVYGDVLLDGPVQTLVSGRADPSGTFHSSGLVPLQLAGSTLWLHALEVKGPSTGFLSNPMAVVIP